MLGASPPAASAFKPSEANSRRVICQQSPAPPLPGVERRSPPGHHSRRNPEASSAVATRALPGGQTDQQRGERDEAVQLAFPGTPKPPPQGPPSRNRQGARGGPALGGDRAQRGEGSRWPVPAAPSQGRRPWGARLRPRSLAAPQAREQPQAGLDLNSVCSLSSFFCLPLRALYQHHVLGSGPRDVETSTAHNRISPHPREGGGTPFEPCSRWPTRGGRPECEQGSPTLRKAGPRSHTSLPTDLIRQQEKGRTKKRNSN